MVVHVGGIALPYQVEAKDLTERLACSGKGSPRVLCGQRSPLLGLVACRLGTLWHLPHSGPVVPGRGGCGEMPSPLADSHSSGDDRF